MGYMVASIETYVSLHDQKIIPIGIKAEYWTLLAYQNYRKIQYLLVG